MRNDVYMANARIDDGTYSKIKFYLKKRPKKSISEFINETLENRINELFRDSLVELIGTTNIKKVITQLDGIDKHLKDTDKAMMKLRSQSNKLQEGKTVRTPRKK